MTKKLAILLVLFLAVALFAAVDDEVSQSAALNSGVFKMPPYPTSGTMSDADMAAFLGLQDFNEPNGTSGNGFLNAIIDHHH